MKLIIKNSFLGKHVYDEAGKEVSQISSHVINPTQTLLLLDQQKTYTSTFQRVGKSNTQLQLFIEEQGKPCLNAEAYTTQTKAYERSIHDLSITDQYNHIYHLHLNSDTSWQIDDTHDPIGTISKMDAYGNVHLECKCDDLLLLCSFYLFTRTIMNENEMLMV